MATDCAPAYPEPSLASKVKPVVKKLSTDGPKENLEQFTSFRTRRTSLVVLEGQLPRY